MRFAQALIPPQLVHQRANPCRPQQHTASPFRQAVRPTHLSGSARIPFRVGPRIPFRVSPRAPLSAGPAHLSRLGCAAPVRPTGPGLFALPGRGLQRPTGPGVYALPGRACTPSGRGLRGARTSSGPGASAPFRGRAARLPGRTRSPFRAGSDQHHARDAYPAVRPRHFFRNTCGLSTSEPSACGAFCRDSFTMLERRFRYEKDVDPLWPGWYANYAIVNKAAIGRCPASAGMPRKGAHVIP